MKSPKLSIAEEMMSDSGTNSRASNHEDGQGHLGKGRRHQVLGADAEPIEAQVGQEALRGTQ